MEKLTIHPQIIKDTNGQEIGVFLPMNEFQKLLDEIEEWEDIKAADKATNRPDKQFIPIEQAWKEINGQG